MKCGVPPRTGQTVVGLPGKSIWRGPGALPGSRCRGLATEGGGGQKWWVAVSVPVEEPAAENAFAEVMHRFALVLTGDEAGAGQVCAEILAEARRRPAVFTERGRSKLLLLAHLRRAALKLKPPAASSSLAAPMGEIPADAADKVRQTGAAGVLRILHGLPEPDRSAAALFYLGALDCEGIQHFLDLDLSSLAAALQAARVALAESGEGRA